MFSNFETLLVHKLCIRHKHNIYKILHSWELHISRIICPIISVRDWIFGQTNLSVIIVNILPVACRVMVV